MYPVLEFICLILILDKYASQFGSGSQYAYYHDEDESTFHLVDTTRVQKPPYQRGRFKANQRNMRGRGNRGGMQSGMQALGKGVKARDRDRKNQIRRYGQGRVSNFISVNSIYICLGIQNGGSIGICMF